jgi:purine-binding chemotaxis protein CheW
MQATADPTDAKFLGFQLGEETYAIEILKVREIIGLLEITPVPKSASHFRGVVNLRGKIVPVLDMRDKFGMPQVEARRENCIITVEIAGPQGPLLVGILVDAVSEVMTVPGHEREALPDLGDSQRMDFVLGLAKSKGKVSILLNIDRVLQAADLSSLRDLQAAQPAA